MSPTRSLATLAALTALALLGVQSAPVGAAGSSGKHTGTSPIVRESGVRTPPNADVRAGTPTAERKATKRWNAQLSKTDRRFVSSLGEGVLIDIDPLTGTARTLSRLDGALTSPRAGSARTIAWEFVRDHAGVIGLSPADLTTLRLHRSYVDVGGTTHLSYVQSVRGIQVFGNGLKVHVASDGRVLAVQGSPIADLVGLAAAARSHSISADAARSSAAKDLGNPLKASLYRDASAKRWILTPNGLRPGWQTVVQAGDLTYAHVVDAVSGKALYRRNLVSHDKGDALYYKNYPGAESGGTRTTVNIKKKGWLLGGSNWLTGHYAWAWADLNDDGFWGKKEKTPVPGTATKAQFKLVTFGALVNDFCADFVCTWDPETPKSWQANQNADVTQAFVLVSSFHDYLKGGPIGFTKNAGNFEMNLKKPQKSDPVFVNALDGAKTDGGLPDPNHVDNANMLTLPDTFPAQMQLYLFHQPGLDNSEDPFVPTSASFDASVVYHEYIHGLSNRLVIDVDGWSTLNSLQANAMGEGWSDYYAMDYLVAEGLDIDDAADGDVLVAEYLAAGASFRTMGIDCPVGSSATACEGAPGRPGGPGGFTYGEFADPDGLGPEVHSSGEIWAQILWDVRTELGRTTANSLITRAMELSPADPSYVDMRNALLLADQANFSGANEEALWEVFAERGLGYFAGAIDGSDAAPGEDFSLPPTGTPDAAFAGTVTDPATGPVEGATVSIAGFPSATAVTDANGDYEITGLFAGTYPKVSASKAGFLGDVTSATTGNTVDFEIRRDWAAESGGASVDGFTGPDFSGIDCGPDKAIDIGSGTVWGSNSGPFATEEEWDTPTGTFVPKEIIIQLSDPVDISAIGVDPTAGCGDAGSSSVGDYEIFTSTNGITFTSVADGHFGVDDRGQMTEIPLATNNTNIAYVKFVILGNQVVDSNEGGTFETICPDGPFTGCTYTDMTELLVFGTAS